MNSSLRSTITRRPGRRIIGQSKGVIDILPGEVEAQPCELLERVGKTGFLNCAANCFEREISTQPLHDKGELADIHALAANRTHEELPVRRVQLGCRKRDRHHFDAGILGAALFDLGRWSQDHHIIQRPRCCAIASSQLIHLRIARVGQGHGRELRLVVERRAVVEDDAGQRVGERIDSWNRHAGHFNHTAQRVALAASLHAEQADRVRLVQVQCHLASRNLTEQPELGRSARHAEDRVILRDTIPLCWVRPHCRRGSGWFFNRRSSPKARLLRCPPG